MTVFPEGYVAERLERALSLARARGVDGAEAVFDGEELDLVRLAGATLTQASSITRAEVGVRVVVGGIEGMARTNDLSNLGDAGLAHCVERALGVARLGALRPEVAGARGAVVLPPPAPLEPAPAWALDEGTVHLSAADKAAWLAPALAAHARDGLDLAGRFHTGRVTRAVRSTTGVAAYHQGSGCDLLLSTLERPAGHHASATRCLVDARIDEARVVALLDEVRRECQLAHAPMELAPAAFDVVLAPLALASLLGWFGGLGFSSRAVEDGTSFAAGRLGEQVTGEALTLVDDGAMPLGIGLPSPFDVEGQPRRRVTLIEQGVARAVVYDSVSAQRAGCASTGHASARNLFSQGGARPLHLHLMPGTAPSLDALVGKLERGLLVTRLHYVNGHVEPRRAVMTGLLRDAAFLVEDGRIVRAVQPLRFTDSMLEAFARIDGPGSIGATPIAVGGGNGWEQPTVCPPVLVRGLRFTSGR